MISLYVSTGKIIALSLLQVCPSHALPLYTYPFQGAVLRSFSRSVPRVNQDNIYNLFAVIERLTRFLHSLTPRDQQNNSQVPFHVILDSSSYWLALASTRQH